MADQSRLSFSRTNDGTLKVRLTGAWRLRGGFPSTALVQRELDSSAKAQGIAFEAQDLTSWDSSVLTFLVEVSELCRQRGIQMDRADLPAGLRRLLDLAEAVRKRRAPAKRRSKYRFSNAWVTRQ